VILTFGVVFCYLKKIELYKRSINRQDLPKIHGRNCQHNAWSTLPQAACSSYVLESMIARGTGSSSVRPPKKAKDRKGALKRDCDCFAKEAEVELGQYGLMKDLAEVNPEEDARERKQHDDRILTQSFVP
jgi:hypothetical protein